MSRLVALALVVLSGCLPAQPRLALETEPPFDVFAFFQGETAGLGVLHIRGRAPVPVEVESVGTVLESGDLELVQTITRGDDEPYQRTWTFRALGDGRYTGDLTEATGPVEAEASGNRLVIGYRTGRFTTVSQTLALQPGGRLALNLLSVRVLGVPVARLTEQIRRVEDE
ncbi:DUF3833 family protein [Rubrivirga sp.]|uniref:DUF3833 family protein n=1 Tax=Rubrivirga sp. TaxID=1885344 RepID=UPI003C7356F1